MTIEAITRAFWELSGEVEAMRRGEADGSPVVTLTELASLTGRAPAESRLARAIDHAVDRIPVGDGSQRDDLARLRGAPGRRRAYHGRDPVWYWRPAAEVWIEAEVSHFDRAAERWCVRCDHSGLVCYAEATELTPRHPGEIAPGVRRFGP